MFRTNRNQITKFIVFNILFLATLYFAFTSLDIEKLELISFNKPELFILSIILFFLFYLVLSIAWVQTLKIFNKKSISYKNTLSFWASQIFKYLPTSLFVISFRIYYAKRQGNDTKSAIKATLLENLILIYTSFSMYLLFSNLIILYALSIGLYLLLVYLVIHNQGVKQLVKNIKPLRFVADLNQKSFKYLVSILIFQSIGWIVSGLALYFFAYSVGEEAINSLDVIASQAASYGASILAVFAPGGLGIKEYFLSFSGIEVNTILNWRFITIFFDLIFSIIAIIIISRTNVKS